MSWRRPEIRQEEGREPAQVFIPQTHRPGAEAEVDFGEVWVDLAGARVKCHLFALRMSYSGKAVHRIFASGGQEAFFEGHVHAFDVLGGIPAEQIRYDNLGAHEKGGVEHEIGRFRRNHLVPVPVVGLAGRAEHDASTSG